MERDKRNQALWGIDGQTHDYEGLLAIADPAIAKEVSPEKWQSRYDACQEGNYGLVNVMSGARYQDRMEAQAASNSRRD